MSTTTQNEARKIRASLKHPVIDADGHWAEFPRSCARSSSVSAATVRGADWE